MSRIPGYEKREALFFHWIDCLALRSHCMARLTLHLFHFHSLFLLYYSSNKWIVHSLTQQNDPEHELWSLLHKPSSTSWAVGSWLQSYWRLMVETLQLLNWIQILLFIIQRFSDLFFWVHYSTKHNILDVQKSASIAFFNQRNVIFFYLFQMQDALRTGAVLVYSIHKFHEVQRHHFCLIIFCIYINIYLWIQTSGTPRIILLITCSKYYIRVFLKDQKKSSC